MNSLRIIYKNKYIYLYIYKTTVTLRDEIQSCNNLFSKVSSFQLKKIMRLAKSGKHDPCLGGGGAGAVSKI